MRLTDDRTRHPLDSGEIRVARAVDPGDWASINVLVYGPPGSGKLSFVRGLGRVARPLADIHVHDFQTDGSAQTEQIQLLVSGLAVRHPDPVHLIRHLHRLRGRRLMILLEALEGAMARRQSGGAVAPPLCVHATSYDGIHWPKVVREGLERVFPCWIQMREGCASQRDLPRFVRQVIGDLNQRYGRHVTEIDAEILNALRHQAGRSLHQMRNLLERVYVTSSTTRLSKEDLIRVIGAPSDYI